MVPRTNAADIPETEVEMLVVPPEDGGEGEGDEGPSASEGSGQRSGPSSSVAAGKRMRARVEARRESVGLVGATLDVIERDSAIGGGIAGALAYRLFFFLLPLGLVAIGILGLVSDATGGRPRISAGPPGWARS
jgi:hypothetical protein